MDATAGVSLVHVAVAGVCWPFDAVRAADNVSDALILRRSMAGEIASDCGTELGPGDDDPPHAAEIIRPANDQPLSGSHRCPSQS